MKYYIYYSRLDTTMNRTLIASICLVLLLSIDAFGQEEEKPRHKLTLMMTQAHVPSAIDEAGEKSWLILPGWGFDYDYLFVGRWGVGIHTEMVVEDFEIESADDIIKKRTRPLTTVLCVSRKFGDHITLYMGPGIEFSKEENLGMLSTEFEYGWELPDDWEIAACLISEIKFGEYNSWVLGFGVSKLF